MGLAVQPAALRPISVLRLLVGAASFVYPVPGVVDFAIDLLFLRLRGPHGGCWLLGSCVAGWMCTGSRRLVLLLMETAVAASVLAQG